MNILIAGAGRLGQQAAHLLTATGHQVTVIDQDRNRLDQLEPDHLHRLVHGDACEPAILESSGAYTADIVLAATGEDEDNLVLSLLAKRQFGVRRVLARINDPDNTWLFDTRWGIDTALPAATPLISLIEEAAGLTDTIGLLRLSAAGVTLIETHLDDHSTATGRSLSDLPLPPGTVVAAVVRDGRPTVPGAAFRFHAGDTVLVVAETATDTDIHRAFQDGAG